MARSTPPAKEWFKTGGLACIRFPVHSEYKVLDQLLTVLNENAIALVHSKQLRNKKQGNVLQIDATGHALTPHTALRQRIGEVGNSEALENPSDTQAILSELRRLKKSNPKTNWWIWWSPSDMLTQNIGEGEIVRCLRAIAKDFSDVSFLALVPRCVHTQQGLALLDYVSEIVIDFDEEWSILKHPSMEKMKIEA